MKGRADDADKREQRCDHRQRAARTYFFPFCHRQGTTTYRETTWRAVTRVCSPTRRTSQVQTRAAILRTISGTADPEQRYAAVHWSFTHAVHYPIAGRFCATLLREIGAISVWCTRKAGCERIAGGLGTQKPFQRHLYRDRRGIFCQRWHRSQSPKIGCWHRVNRGCQFSNPLG